MSPLCHVQLEHFWQQDHFVDDLSQPIWPSGDAQILPFWCGAFDHNIASRQRWDTVLYWLDEQGLNTPLPCCYGVLGQYNRRMHLLNWLNPWQQNTVWTCLGLHFLEVLRDFSHPRFIIELERYRLLVEQLGCFPEVLNPKNSQLYEGALILSEDSMLWAANLWSMLNKSQV
ncbi:MAG: hypothetical protein JW841_04750 [Deltaproteobacteria bacterium]|nr:hypothetical protein [Deltaproteobacteria bacterium]